ncbi:UNVERIFIED_CONTAM: Pentatricopeptide repeat-containing protein [Sesamum calycinum]|uniref:Pentatricopeptide repeat-containing protein n=1 Tax=Sesamum calycinum TaxID=2727403 RepID=A0AAW2SZ70_9LAMI
MKEYKCEPTIKSYVTVFSILVDESQLKMAFKFYRYMREKGIPASVASLNVLIKALCKSSGTLDSAFRIFHEMPKHGHTPNSYTYGTLINGLCRAGRTLEAKELLIDMEANGCSPSVITYSCLIHGFCRSNKLEDAMELLKDMKSKGIEPNVYTYSSLIDGFCKNGHSLQAMELLERMIRKRLVPNSIIYSSLIYGFCKEGKLHEAIQILDHMKLQYLKPDAGLYSKITNGFCEINKFWEAANFLDEMVLSGITPNRLTWDLHVRVHNRVIQGDLHKAGRIMNEMVIDGCIPDVETWNAMLDAFWDRKKVREAAELLLAKLMDEFQNTAPSRTYMWWMTIMERRLCGGSVGRAMKGRWTNSWVEFNELAPGAFGAPIVPAEQQDRYRSSYDTKLYGQYDASCAGPHEAVESKIRADTYGHVAPAYLYDAPVDGPTTKSLSNMHGNAHVAGNMVLKGRQKAWMYILSQAGRCSFLYLRGIQIS